MDSYTGPFASGPIRPIVRPGENVLLIDREGYYLYMVAYLEPIPLSAPVLINGGALAASAIVTTGVGQTRLDMPYGQLGQFRSKVLDDILVTFLQPQATMRKGTRDQTGTLNAFTSLYFPNDEPTEMFIFEDQRLFLRMENPRAVALAQSRVAFYGFKYVLSGPGGAASGGHILPFKRWNSIQEAMASDYKFTVVPTGGWGR